MSSARWVHAAGLRSVPGCMSPCLAETDIASGPTTAAKHAWYTRAISGVVAARFGVTPSGMKNDAPASGGAGSGRLGRTCSRTRMALTGSATPGGGAPGANAKASRWRSCSSAGPMRNRMKRTYRDLMADFMSQAASWVVVGSALTSSGQISCQSLGRRSCRVTWKRRSLSRRAIRSVGTGRFLRVSSEIHWEIVGGSTPSSRATFDGPPASMTAARKRETSALSMPATIRHCLMFVKGIAISDVQMVY